MIQNYFLQLESLLYVHPLVDEVLDIEKEVVDSNKGWFKAKLIINGHELYVFEFVETREKKPCMLKYGYHLQTKSGSLVIRWDNAEHHTEIKTFPYHVHVTEEKNVEPSEPMNLKTALEKISEILKKSS